MSDTILRPGALPGATIPSHTRRAMTTVPHAMDWDRFGDRPMTWDDQGDRDPRVSNLTAWLWKLAALGVSVSFFLLIIGGIRLLVS